MRLSPKAKRILWVALALLLIVGVLGGWFTWEKFFRQEPQVFANEAEQFK